VCGMPANALSQGRILRHAMSSVPLSIDRHSSTSRLVTPNVRVERAARGPCSAPQALKSSARLRRATCNHSRPAPTHS
jgi:hypothetical protein